MLHLIQKNNNDYNSKGKVKIFTDTKIVTIKLYAIRQQQTIMAAWMSRKIEFYLWEHDRRIEGEQRNRGTQGEYLLYLFYYIAPIDLLPPAANLRTETVAAMNTRSTAGAERYVFSYLKTFNNKNEGLVMLKRCGLQVHPSYF